MKKEEHREDFCSLCLVAPLAFAGASATAVGSNVSKNHKTWKKTLLISGISTIVFSILLLIYYYFSKGCTECTIRR
jgi:tellurite resistance protein TehA-like permease